ncbi:TPA: hypothetical protein U2L65_000693 [Citrobacter farmeri]|uniref:hypothetical protein n=1 Tax=Citrobacter farmeri TaxID=67824 RepID=UPI001E50EF32|nr:hypothetical protein [Citrobacter farmeri]GJL45252.1 hypothetical protein TUM17580_13110 [Citrobacter farmeri]HCD7252466.1 hypothetical protein [Citrobacter farmeri]HCD7631368.1 hypothetical protein [Citrobacter farmeri]HEM7970530.1 hypothetical protein [Citrobacter farmeri]HEM7983946.1 hypothetical protein [Citrobacter farmeri]
MTNSALREELLNLAIGSNHHLRKLALSLLDELEAKDEKIAELEAWELRLPMAYDINVTGERIELSERLKFRQITTKTRAGGMCRSISKSETNTGLAIVTYA